MNSRGNHRVVYFLRGLFEEPPVLRDGAGEEEGPELREGLVSLREGLDSLRGFERVGVSVRGRGGVSLDGAGLYSLTGRSVRGVVGRLLSFRGEVLLILSRAGAISRGLVRPGFAIARSRLGFVGV